MTRRIPEELRDLTEVAIAEHENGVADFGDEKKISCRDLIEEIYYRAVVNEEITEELGTADRYEIKDMIAEAIADVCEEFGSERWHDGSDEIAGSLEG